jgi:hypothetical protein
VIADGERRLFRIDIHLGDAVEESSGDPRMPRTLS